MTSLWNSSPFLSVHLVRKNFDDTLARPWSHFTSTRFKTKWEGVSQSFDLPLFLSLFVVLCTLVFVLTHGLGAQGNRFYERIQGWCTFNSLRAVSYSQICCHPFFFPISNRYPLPSSQISPRTSTCLSGSMRIRIMRGYC